MDIPFMPQLTAMPMLYQVYVQRLDDILHRVMAAVQVNAMSALKPGVPAFSSDASSINFNIINNALILHRQKLGTTLCRMLSGPD